GELGDGDGTHQLPWRRLTRDQPPDGLKDQAGVLDISLDAQTDGFKRARLDALGLVADADTDKPLRSSLYRLIYRQRFTGHPVAARAARRVKGLTRAVPDDGHRDRLAGMLRDRANKLRRKRHRLT